MNRRDKVNMKREKWLTLGLIIALVMSPVTDVYAQESNGTYENPRLMITVIKKVMQKMGQQKIEI